jgi:hypothetical protein
MQPCVGVARMQHLAGARIHHQRRIGRSTHRTREGQHDTTRISPKRAVVKRVVVTKLLVPASGADEERDDRRPFRPKDPRRLVPQLRDEIVAAFEALEDSQTDRPFAGHAPGRFEVTETNAPPPRTARMPAAG